MRTDCRRDGQTAGRTEKRLEGWTHGKASAWLNFKSDLPHLINPLVYRFVFKNAPNEPTGCYFMPNPVGFYGRLNQGNFVTTYDVDCKKGKHLEVFGFVYVFYLQKVTFPE